MEHFEYFAAAYFVIIFIFFAYVATLQKKIKLIQREIDQIKSSK